MKLGLTERQYKLVISEVVKNQEIGEQEEPVNPEPEAGTSAQQSGVKVILRLVSGKVVLQEGQETKLGIQNGLMWLVVV